MVAFEEGRRASDAATGGPSRLSLTDPAAIASLFPATQQAQQHAFSALILASEAATPAARAAALSNSVLASAYMATSAGKGARQELSPNDALGEQQRQVTNSYDKMERSRLRHESMERVRNVCAAWDRPPAPLAAGERRHPVEADKELGEVKNAVARWLSQGEVREESSSRIATVLTELDAWLRAELASPAPARDADDSVVKSTSAPGASSAGPESTAAPEGQPEGSGGEAERSSDAEQVAEEAAAREVMQLLSERESTNAQLAKQLNSLLQDVKESALRRSGATGAKWVISTSKAPR